jgi:nitrite reductase/ring-hydroxylating ferredoxin subunit
VSPGYENPQRPGKAGAPGMGQAIYETGVNFYEFSTTVPVPGSEKALNTMIGSGPEVNNGEIWDPLGFSKLYDRNFDFNGVMTYPHVQWLREAEIKHGRCAMLAFVGAVTQSFFSIPGYPTESNYWAALQACYDDPVARVGIVQISVVILLLEGRYYPTDAWIGQMDREPGDLGWDPIKLSKKPNFDFQQKQLSELKNGRLAMVGMASLACEHVLPGSVPLLSGAPALARESAAASSPAFCGATPASAAKSNRTQVKYTTQTILPALAWLKVGFKEGDLQPTELRAVNLGGTDVLVGKTEAGKLFCVGNLCPHLGTPMSEGADVIGDVIVCPLHGSSFKTTDGDLIDWCVSPPIIGPLTGLVIEKKKLAIFEVRTSFFGGDIEVQVDTNAKKAYEADYWKGVLDAQGKNDGTFY